MDLKAELYRKQEQFKQEKLGQDNNAAAGLKSKPKVKVALCVHLLLWFYLLHHFTNRDVFVLLYRNLMCGVNKTPAFQPELRKMWSSWLRNSAAWTRLGEPSASHGVHRRNLYTGDGNL